MANDNLKSNIIKWYPFAKDAEILQITDKIEQIEEKQYDYVIMLGTLEYAHKLFKSQNPEIELMEFAKRHLKEEGKILIVVNNKIGAENYCQKINNYPKERKKLNRKTLEELLEKSGLKYYKFYYPLPDYETTNVIFTDKFLPNQETITRNTHLHQKDEILFKPENDMFLEIIEQDRNLFKLFANSYFVECSKTEFEDNQIQLVSFSNMRKQKYSIQTIIKGDTVYKTALNEQAKEHIENIKINIDTLNKLGFQTLDSYTENVIKSKYQEEESFDNIIIGKIKNGQKEEAMQLITQFFEEIKEKLCHHKSTKNIFDTYQISYDKKQLEGLNFTQYGLWDLIFQNAFYINNQFFFYDQEWMEDGIPIEYIFYRSIMYTRELKDILDIEQIWQQFGITKEQIELFLLLDDKIQENIRDSEIWELSKNGKYVENLQIDYLTANHQINLLNIEKAEKDRKLADDELKISELKKELEGIYDSRSWKIAQKISKLKNK